MSNSHSIEQQQIDKLDSMRGVTGSHMDLAARKNGFRRQRAQLNYSYGMLVRVWRRRSRWRDNR